MSKMTKFICKFDEEFNGQYGTPKYIRGNGFDAFKMFHKFELMDILVTREMQQDYLDSAVNMDGGWVAFVCGVPEMCRMFAYTLMRYYSHDTDKLRWHRVNSSRYDILLDERFRSPYHMIVVDSLLTHPKMHPNAFRSFDPGRIGKIHDIVAEYRGESSLVILCPELTPEEAYQVSLVQADLLFYLRPKVKDIEL